MSKSNKPEDQRTIASATELDEDELAGIEGGGIYCKLEVEKGAFDGKGNDLVTETYAGKTKDLGSSRERNFATEEIKRIK